MVARRVNRLVRRPGNKNADATIAGRAESASLVNFLAAIQTYKLPILPVAYESGLEIIGRGLSGGVHQATADAVTMLAFKEGVPSRLRRDNEESQEWYSLVTEISVLQHRPIRQHGHITNLLGVTFWTDSGARAWPLVITRKAELGDLGSFLARDGDVESVGLTGEWRSQIMREVVDAVFTLHSCGMSLARRREL